jgi:hypothetical protein
MNMHNLRPVLSFGGGVNSTALAILLAQQGWHGHIVFCDTGAEYDETYHFLQVFDGWLSQHRLSITRLGAEYREEHYKMPLTRAMEQYGQIPLIRARWCTTAYKIDPLRRWCTEHGYDPDADVMVGIAYDEAHRQPGKIRPLVEWRITRDMCAQIIRGAGLPVPRKSGCWFCPFQSYSQLRHLFLERPDRFAWMIWIEQRASFGSGRRITFHPDGEPMAQIALRFRTNQPTLFDLSEFYQPCLCRV